MSKGGTAINLFVRDMPRLFVDIDLTYTSITNDRETALGNISDPLKRIDESVKATNPGISITHIPYDQWSDVKLNCQIPNDHVKIEVNTITCGIILPTRIMQLTEVAQKDFGKFAAIQFVIVPLWSSSPPESVVNFFTQTDFNTTVFNFFGPPGWL